MIDSICPHCGAHLVIHEKFSGESGTCKKCSGQITVPIQKNLESNDSQQSSFVPEESVETTNDSTEEDAAIAAMRRRRFKRPLLGTSKTIYFLVPILCFIAYVATGPYRTAAALKTGIIEKDSEILSDNIDFPNLRQNMKDQLNAVMADLITDDLEDNPFGVFTAGLGTLMVDRIVDVFVTPTQLARMMAGDSASLNDEENEREITKEDLFKDARYEYDSIDKFSIWVPNDDGDEIRFVIRREGIKWKLVNISFAHLLESEYSKNTTKGDPLEVTESKTTIVDNSYVSSDIGVYADDIRFQDVTYIVAVEAICDEYDDNEFAADAKYKGKTAVVNGIIFSIGKNDSSGEPFIVIEAGDSSDAFSIGFDRVRCLFAVSQIDKIAQLSEGQKVSVKGKVDGYNKISGVSVVLKKCSIVRVDGIDWMPSRSTAKDTPSEEKKAEQIRREESDYIKNHVRLYAFEAKYITRRRDSTVPGVSFKIKNDGEKTLYEVNVTVYFKDAEGNIVAEDDFSPVNRFGFISDGDSGPLKPGYIWQPERGKFYVCESVPSEWDPGNAEIEITGVSFNEKSSSSIF
jgi:DNA-directed RNA polymerase subunit M/transcription elongation factor TFIIS